VVDISTIKHYGVGQWVQTILVRYWAQQVQIDWGHSEFCSWQLCGLKYHLDGAYH